MLNKVLLIGNLTQDPELRYTPQGTPVATVRLACTEKYRPSGGGDLKEDTLFINCVLWRNQATVAHQYLKKGSRCYMEGKLSIRDYEKDGIKRWITEVIVNKLVLLDRRPTEGGSAPSHKPEAGKPAHADEDDFSIPDFNDEDIPFS
jgi:single-strand DNA-binding protein